MINIAMLTIILQKALRVKPVNKKNIQDQHQNSRHECVLKAEQEQNIINNTSHNALTAKAILRSD